ncbi:MAG: tyrosine-type recombinase/integrase, partial [Alphaproteobacteria bacterium]|nr:tyrosine-type recombinase/integrase [Alphaproteobacteria bacterium]
VLRLKQPKSESSHRTIEIPGMTVEILRQHRARQAEYRMKLGRPDNDWLVFETPHVKEDGSVEFRPWRPRNVTKAFALFIKRTPVTKITLHGLRHTHITSALMAGENIKVVSERAGHSGVQITLDTYGHVIGGKDRDIAVSHEQRLMAYLGKS